LHDLFRDLTLLNKQNVQQLPKYTIIYNNYTEICEFYSTKKNCLHNGAKII